MSLNIRLFDEYNVPCCANVGVYRDDVRLWRRYVEETTSIDLPDGSYTLVVQRGKQYLPVHMSLLLQDGKADADIHMERLHDPKKMGWYAFDAHSHISRTRLGKDAVMDIPQMSVRARGEDWNVYFAGTPYDGENHEHVYKGIVMPVTYREYYRAVIEKTQRDDYLVDPGGEFIKYRYGHIVLANFEERPPIDEFRDPLYHTFEQWRHVPKVEPPSFVNIPPSRALKKYRNANSFAFFAHPTSWWRMERSGSFVTNISSTIAYDSLTGMVDAMVVQGYGADKPYYRNLWYALLNHGYRLTGIAETDHCGDDVDHLEGRRMVEPYRTYARCHALDLNALSKAVRDGDCFASSGPLVDLTVDDVRPGSRIPFDPQREYTLCMQGWKCCEGELKNFEVVVNGKTAGFVQPDADGKAQFTTKLSSEGYVLCILRDEAANVAVTNPVYIRNSAFLNEEYRAHVTLRVKYNGKGANGFFTTDESDDPVVFDGKIELRINPMSRIFITVDGEQQIYDPFFDEELQSCFRYSYSGEFLKEYPDCTDGQVPPEAFCIERILDRLQKLSTEIDFGYSEDFGKRAKNLIFETGAQEPLVCENTFKAAEPTTSFPEKSAFSDDMPKLIWEGHEDVSYAAKRAFEITGEKLRLPAEGSGYIKPLLYTEFADSVFMWGNCFNTMYGEYASKAMSFIELLDNFYAKQHKDGYICRQLDIHSGEDRFEKFDPSSTGPDIFSLAEWMHYLHTGDTQRLKRVYPVLLAFHRWLKRNRTWPSGAYYSSGWGCGMDNIPRSRDAEYNPFFGHGHLSFIDTTAQQALDTQLLTAMAEVCGIEVGKEELAEEYGKLDRIINEKMWNEDDGFYEDCDRDGCTTGVMHIGAYWTLLAGVVPKHRLNRFIAHLENEEEFASPMGTRSLSAKHPEFVKNGGNYWQGGVWCITELMIVLGLKFMGMHDLAHKLARKHVEAVAQVCCNTDTIWESYDPMLIAPGRLFGNLVRRDFVGFSGVTPILMALENVLGICVRQDGVHWDIRLAEKHGVENLHADGQNIALLYENGTIQIECERRMRLFVGGKTYDLAPGKQTITDIC